MAGGWELTVVYQHHSGQFLTPLWTGPDPTGTAFTTSGTPAQVTIRPNQLGDPNLPSSERTTTAGSIEAAFAPPTPGSFGTAAKGVINGPGSDVWDVGFAKHFDLGEGLRMRWELTGTNFFNRRTGRTPATTSARWRRSASSAASAACRISIPPARERSAWESGLSGERA